jgi:hypothetical protein
MGDLCHGAARRATGVWHGRSLAELSSSSPEPFDFACRRAPVRAAARAYAAEHDRHYGAIPRLTGWMRTLFYDPGPEAASLRARALPRLAEEPTRDIDLVGLGPDAPSDEAARRRFFGED